MLHINTLTKQLGFLETLYDEVYELRSVTPTAIYLTYIRKNATQEDCDLRTKELTLLIHTLYKLPYCSVIVTNYLS